MRSLPHSLVSVCVFGVVVVLASVWLNAWDVSGDVAKFALGIEFPHPTLVTSVMAWMYRWVGPWNAAVRFPLVVLLGMASAGVVREALARGVSRSTAFVLALALAFVPTTIAWTRDGYLPIALVATWMVMAAGFRQIEATPSRVQGHALFLLGAVLGVWTQLQGMLVVPVVVWMAWRHRDALRQDGWLAALYGIAGVQAGLVVLGMLTNPLAIADLVSVGGRGIAFHDRLQMLLPWAWWLPLLLFGGIVGYRRAPRAEWLFWGISTVPLLLYLGKNPAIYYGPYGMWFVLFPLIWLLRAWPLVLRPILAVAACVALGWHLTHLVPPDRDFFVRHGAALQVRVQGKTVAVLGTFPYDVPFHLLTLPRRWPTDPKAKEEIDVVVVWDEASLDARDREVHASLSCTLMDRLQVCHPR